MLTFNVVAKICQRFGRTGWDNWHRSLNPHSTFSNGHASHPTNLNAPAAAQRSTINSTSTLAAHSPRLSRTFPTRCPFFRARTSMLQHLEGSSTVTCCSTAPPKLFQRLSSPGYLLRAIPDRSHYRGSSCRLSRCLIHLTSCHLSVFSVKCLTNSSWPLCQMSL